MKKLNNFEISLRQEQKCPPSILDSDYTFVWHVYTMANKSGKVSTVYCGENNLPSWNHNTYID